MLRAWLLILVLLGVGGSALGQLQGKVVCIDPGHPSEVGRGTKGKKLTEIRVAWDMALLVRDRLRAMGAKVVLTKPELDRMVRNRDRAAVANNSKADLLLRLHCDAASGSGFTVYYPTRQGKAHGVTGPSQKMLDEVAPMATRFHAALAKGMKGKLADLGLKSDLKTAIGAKQGALTGSIFSKVPPILVELVVLTNPKDEAFIASTSNRKAYADALARAVVAAVRDGA